MVTVLRKFLGNQAINGDWRKHMEIHSKWSKSTFDRKLRILKARGWMIAPGVSSQFGSEWCQESATLNGAADAAAKAAMELLRRLNKGRPPSAA
jgi:hypothetical protein